LSLSYRAAVEQEAWNREFGQIDSFSYSFTAGVPVTKTES